MTVVELPNQAKELESLARQVAILTRKCGRLESILKDAFSELIHAEKMLQDEHRGWYTPTIASRRLALRREKLSIKYASINFTKEQWEALKIELNQGQEGP